MATPQDRLRLAMRLSTLVYEPVPKLREWREGKRVEVTDVPFGEVFEPAECTPKAFVALGKDPDAELHHKAQWIACEAGGTLFVCFKGTDAVQDMVLDLSLPQLQTASGMRVHSGFYSGVQGELAHVLRTCNASACERVVFCGHSLGGAMAIVALYELSSSALWKKDRYAAEGITFGAPLVLCHGEQATHYGQLPQVFSERPPRLLNVVNNFDIVPRALALQGGDLAATLEVAPALFLPQMANIFGLAKRSGLLKLGGFVDSVEGMRKHFRPTGTFLFAQSHASEDCGRNVSATYLSSPDEIASALAYFPGPSSGTDDERTDFVAGAISDHLLAGGYWPVVDQLCRGDALWDKGYDRAVNVTDGITRVGQVEQLEAYDPDFLAVTGGGILMPPQTLLDHMDDATRARLEFVQKEVMELLEVAKQTKAAAIETAKAQQPESPFNFTSFTTSHTAGSVCALKAKMKLKAKLRKAEDLIKKEVHEKEEESHALAHAAEAAMGKTNAVVVVNHTSSEIVVEIPAKGVKKPEDMTVRIPTGEAVDVGRDAAQWSTPAQVAYMTVVVAGKDRPVLKLAYPDKLREATTTKTPCYVVQSSPLLPLVALEGRITRDAKTFQHTVTVPKTVTPRCLRLHDLAQVLDVDGVAERTFSLCDARPPGFVVSEAHWGCKETCELCDVKFRNGMMSMFAAARHHCRGCGISVCEGCSKGTRVLCDYSNTGAVGKVRVCKGCEQSLACGFGANAAHVDPQVQ